MLPNEETNATATELWNLLSEQGVFKSIFRIQSQSATLKVALEAECAAENLPSLSSVAEIIQEESEDFTQFIVEWLAEQGLTVANFSPIQH